MSWSVLLALCAISYALKAVGPVLAGGRELGLAGAPDARPRRRAAPGRADPRPDPRRRPPPGHRRAPPGARRGGHPRLAAGAVPRRRPRRGSDGRVPARPWVTPGGGRPSILGNNLRDGRRPTRPRRDDACVLAASSGCRRDPVRAAARAGAGRRARAHRAVGRQPRDGDARLPWRRAAGSGRGHARAVPGGRPAGARQVRLSERRRRGAGTAAAARAQGLLPVSAPDRLRRPGRRRLPRARERANGPGRAGGHRRDRRQRPVGCRAADRRPGDGRRRRHGRMLRRAAALPVPRHAGHARGSRRGPRRRRRRARRRVRAAGRRCRRPRPRDPHERDVLGAAAVARAARPRGHRARPQLVRGPGGAALAGWGVPRRPPRHPLESGRHPVAGPQRPPYAGRPDGGSRSTCCATLPSMRS